jgi:hypothetical protein
MVALATGRQRKTPVVSINRGSSFRDWPHTIKNREGRKAPAAMMLALHPDRLVFIFLRF